MIILSVIGLWLLSTTTSFNTHHRICPYSIRSRRQHLYMGLYDDLNKNDQDNEADYEEVIFLPPLFSFKPDGKEANDLLPQLRRRIDTGVPCYYEPTDEKVIHLIKLTGCNTQDACWALEAHGGNVAAARQDIYYASRLALNKKVDLQIPTDQEIADTDWDAELFQLLSSKEKSSQNGIVREQDEIIRPLGMDANRKNNNNRKKKLQDEGGKPNADSLPGFKPGPVDDEPWFTG